MEWMINASFEFKNSKVSVLLQEFEKMKVFHAWGNFDEVLLASLIRGKRGLGGEPEIEQNECIIIFTTSVF